MSQNKYKITLSEGSVPVLAICIHSEETYTVKINQVLNQDLGTYSFIYEGPRNSCIKNTEHQIYAFIDRMLDQYEKIGVISLHRRKTSRRKTNPINSNVLELGTLSGRTLDEKIKESFSNRLTSHYLTFDDNTKFFGGTEIKKLHHRYNNSSLDVKKKYGFVPKKAIDFSKHKLHIAQLELNGPEPSYERNYLAARCMIESILDYLVSKD